MLEFTDHNMGYNAATGEFVDMVKAGVIDPLKVSMRWEWAGDNRLKECGGVRIVCSGDVVRAIFGAAWCPFFFITFQASGMGAMTVLACSFEP